MRAIWSGAISFGLVNIPVKLYSASEGEYDFKFHFLDKTNMAPVRYAKINKVDGREIPSADIVKGFEYQKGEYVVITDEDFQRANVKKAKTIEILDFTDEDQIDERFYEKPYYLEPDKGAEKPYALLREALRKSGKVGVAKFVLRNKEHLAAVKPVGDVIVLDQLRFANELRDPTEVKTPEIEVRDKEIEMALALIDQLTTDFKPEEYTDTYREELQRVIEEKVSGKAPSSGGSAPKPTNVADLMAALQASLDQGKPAKKLAPKTKQKATAKKR